MGKKNVNTVARTHEGAPIRGWAPTPEQLLRRSVMSCFLWEKEFYEGGDPIAERIRMLAGQVDPVVVGELAVEVRHTHNLRHAPLMLIMGLLDRQKKPTGDRHPDLKSVIARVISRPDEMGELVSLYWNGKRRPLANQLRKGIALAFGKFDEYQLTKWDQNSAAVSVRDVMFLSHPKPADEDRAALYKRIADKETTPPDTWEVALSGGADKKETFTRLLTEGKLGYLALLRNLRNMTQAGVDPELMANAIVNHRGQGNVLPFRYVAAARACPQMSGPLDQALTAKVAGMEPLLGKTIVLVDVSGSMTGALSARSDLTRMDAAATLATIIPGQVEVYSFSNTVRRVDFRREGTIDRIKEIIGSQHHGGTALGEAVRKINKEPHDRLIVITDEQSHDRVPDPVAKQAYMINVASYQNGVSYTPHWTNINGFSESVLKFIGEKEAGQ
jgi:60 kDa SS-A/Ro ribonucleoprotein